MVVGLNFTHNKMKIWELPEEFQCFSIKHICSVDSLLSLSVDCLELGIIFTWIKSDLNID